MTCNLDGHINTGIIAEAHTDTSQMESQPTQLQLRDCKKLDGSNTLSNQYPGLSNQVGMDEHKKVDSLVQNGCYSTHSNKMQSRCGPAEDESKNYLSSTNIQLQSLPECSSNPVDEILDKQIFTAARATEGLHTFPQINSSVLSGVVKAAVKAAVEEADAVWRLLLEEAITNRDNQIQRLEMNNAALLAALTALPGCNGLSSTEVCNEKDLEQPHVGNCHCSALQHTQENVKQPKIRKDQSDSQDVATNQAQPFKQGQDMEGLNFHDRFQLQLRNQGLALHEKQEQSKLCSVMRLSPFSSSDLQASRQHNNISVGIKLAEVTSTLISARDTDCMESEIPCSPFSNNIKESHSDAMAKTVTNVTQHPQDATAVSFSAPLYCI